MSVPLQTLDGCVRLVEALGTLRDPADFASIVRPALAELVGCDVVTSGELVPTSSGVGHESRNGIDVVDRAVLEILRRPLQAALTRARLRGPAAPSILEQLSAQENAVLDLVALGRTNAAIARTLGVSPRTIAKHLEHIYRKLQVANRAGAVARAYGPGAGDQQC